MVDGFVPSQDLTYSLFCSVMRSHGRSALFYHEISKTAGLGPWFYLQDCNGSRFCYFMRFH